MKVRLLKREQWLPIPIEEAGAFFSTPRNLDRVTPPELGFGIQSLLPEEMYEVIEKHFGKSK
jgi:hypothetical protein